MVGHVQPKQATGNHEAERKVQGEALPRLALYRRLFPQSTIDHVRAWLFNMDPTIPPYSKSAIVEAEHFLGLRNKRSSTTCERAFWPVNLHKRELYWTANYPLGRADVNTRDMIDIDECGMKIEATNPRFGKCVSCWERCWIEGAYKSPDGYCSRSITKHGVTWYMEAGGGWYNCIQVLCILGKDYCLVGTALARQIILLHCRQSQCASWWECYWSDHQKWS